MALAVIEILDGRTPAEKRELMRAVRDALAESPRAPVEDPGVGFDVEI